MPKIRDYDITDETIEQLKNEDKDSENNPKWNPTHGGSYTAYVPEYDSGEGWKRISTVKTSHGVPSPIMFGGINDTIGLFGFEQANALAWQYAACSVATPITKKVEVRVQAYEVCYEIKARKIKE